MDARSIYTADKFKFALIQTRSLLLACLLGMFANPGLGQESSKRWWNPATWGSGDQSVRSSTYFSGAGGGAAASSTEKSSAAKPFLSLPSLPWSGGDKDSAAPTKSSPSRLNQIGQTTKRAWNNTADFLNPFNDQPKEPPQQGYQPQNTTPKKGSGMFGWMWREQTTEEPTSVNEFLRQERPRF